MSPRALVLLLASAALLTAAGCAPRAASTPSPTRPTPETLTVALGDDLRVRAIGHASFVVTHDLPWPANALLVEMADKTLVLVATPYTPEATRRLLAWVRTRFGERRTIAINNGFHVDNLGGNAALREAGIPIYGSDLTVELLRERGERTRAQVLAMIGDPTSPAYAAHARVPYLPPDHVFAAKDGLVLRFAEEAVWLIYPGPSQAPDKLAVYFPSRRLLFGGCMLLGGDRVGNVADADLASWPKAVETLAKLPVEIVVPAHSDRLDPGLIRNTLRVLANALTTR